MTSIGKMIGGILLVAGTTIGAGMLALPVSTGMAGFFPSLLLLFCCWLFMGFTAMLLLEANLWMESHSNIISMAKITLGRFGEWIGWAVYLFLLYALTTAYIAGSGPITIDVVYALTGYQIPTIIGAVPLLLLFGLCVYKGAATVDYLNRLLMIGLGIAFLALITLLLPEVKIEYLQRTEWSWILAGTSVVITSFGFHIIIPTLTDYLDHDVRKIRFAILIGSAIPFIVYIIWIYVALGIIPNTGPNSIAEGYQHGLNGAQLISASVQIPKITLLDRLFSFFAIVTSFLGVSLSLSDFLADGFKIEKTSRPGRIILYILTFLPPLAVAYIYPRAFLSALEYAGAYGVMVLLGILPALMVWSGRYYHGFQSSFRAPGGKFALIIVILISLFVIGLELLG